MLLARQLSSAEVALERLGNECFSPEEGVWVAHPASIRVHFILTVVLVQTVIQFSLIRQVGSLFFSYPI